MSLFIFGLAIFGSLMSNSDSIGEGDSAPDFTLVDQNGSIHTLSSYFGQKIVVYFYPKDDTPGCTKEACGIRDNYKEFISEQIKVFGISYDNPESHKKFAKKYEIPFILLSDSDKKVAKLYAANGILFAKRKTYLINEEGRIIKIFQNVDVSDHANEIINEFRTAGLKKAE
ncbi:MAG: peroxiredoxin [Candidatus Neomarinimicrobiota bacterium]